MATKQQIPNLPPGPFDLQVTSAPDSHDGSGHVYLIDGNQRKIASIWGRQEEKIALVDLIINAERALRGPTRAATLKRNTHGKRTL